MVALEAQVAHAKRRLLGANDKTATIQKEEEKQQEKLDQLKVDLESVQRAANAAQGWYPLLI